MKIRLSIWFMTRYFLDFIQQERLISTNKGKDVKTRQNKAYMVYIYDTKTANAQYKTHKQSKARCLIVVLHPKVTVKPSIQSETTLISQQV